MNRFDRTSQQELSFYAALRVRSDSPLQRLRQSIEQDAKKLKIQSELIDRMGKANADSYRESVQNAHYFSDLELPLLKNLLKNLSSVCEMLAEDTESTRREYLHYLSWKLTIVHIIFNKLGIEIIQLGDEILENPNATVPNSILRL